MGIFDGNLFDYWHVELRMRSKILGGTPKDPKIIEDWLRGKTGITDEEEIRNLTIRTLRELGHDMPESPTYEEIREAMTSVADMLHTVGFKRSNAGLYIEDRTVKAMLRESVNILYPWPTAKWGVTKKSARPYFVERVFVEPLEILLDRQEPDGIELFVGHPSGPNGKSSNLTYYEYCMRPLISFDLKVMKDTIKDEWWPAIWEHAQDNGLGAVRSQSYGRFDIEAWEPVDRAHLLTHLQER